MTNPCSIWHLFLFFSQDSLATPTNSPITGLALAMWSTVALFSTTEPFLRDIIRFDLRLRYVAAWTHPSWRSIRGGGGSLEWGRAFRHWLWCGWEWVMVSVPSSGRRGISPGSDHPEQATTLWLTEREELEDGPEEELLWKLLHHLRRSVRRRQFRAHTCQYILCIRHAHTHPDDSWPPFCKQLHLHHTNWLQS